MTPSYTYRARCDHIGDFTCKHGFEDLEPEPSEMGLGIEITFADDPE